MKKIIKRTAIHLFAGLACVLMLNSCKASYNYAMINSPEEAGMIFTRVTPEKATVLASETFAGNYLALDKMGQKLVYLSKVDNDHNLYLIDLRSPNVSQQRTFRNNVVGGFGISPDGKDIVFCAGSEILTTNVDAGSICKQITSSNKDYSPVFTYDGKKIFFHRVSSSSTSSRGLWGTAVGSTDSNIWSYDLTNKEMSMYGDGYCPSPSSNNNEVYILKSTKKDGNSYVEIRRVNYTTGANDVILSNEDYRPSSVSISPDGKWLLFAAKQRVKKSWQVSQIYVMRTDGTELTQITYHQGGNYSPVWSTDSSIYFISGRGNKDKVFAIWKTTFNIR